ncbi:MAG: hypothetical protein K2Q26_00145 [Bdellovibrionales bacterium]|nr:hypothetical protein [Bdellovibrionales bacterium]
MINVNFGLDFKPSQSTPEIFPVFVWRSWALNHFETGSKSAPVDLLSQDISHKDFPEALKQIYPHLTFMELSRLFSCSRSAGLANQLAWDQIFRAYSYNWNTRMEKTVELALTLPPHFQNWMQEHEISPREISPLLSLKEQSSFIPFLEHFTRKSLSRNQGAQLLELAVELHLMKTPISDLFSLPEEMVEEWIARLRKIRYPQTETLDRSIEERLMSLPWTKSFSKRWTRIGDRSGLEVKFLVQSPEDLKNKIKALEEISQKETPL